MASEPAPLAKSASSESVEMCCSSSNTLLLLELALLLCQVYRLWWTDTKVCTLTGAACTGPASLTPSGALPAAQDACYVVIRAINIYASPATSGCNITWRSLFEGVLTQ